MKTLSSTLLTAQKSSSRTPYVTLMARNKVADAVNPEYERIYSGSEPDGPHALAIAGDGSLIRFRVTPAADSKRLLRQRVVSPGPGSNFSSWVDMGRYDVLAVAACTLGNAVSLFWIEGDRSVYHQKSTDNGASWQTPELIATAATTLISGITSAYKGNGDIAVFFTDTDTLYLVKYTSGAWQPATTWDKTTGNLSSVSCIYDSDWNLLVTGRDIDGNYKLWSLVYGDGGDIPAGNWSVLKELATAISDGNYEYRAPFMVKASVTHCFFIEKFSGTQSYSRPFTSHTILESKFVDNLWREPLPFNFSSEYGLAMAYRGDYLWLISPSGVWRADVSEDTLDLSADILSLKEELGDGISKLTVELTNGDGKYSSPGQGSLSLLGTGCELELGLGYKTSGGAETGKSHFFQVDVFEHNISPGKSSLVLHASGGWESLNEWRAHHQFRWNKSTDEASVKGIITFVLARAGIQLEVKTESAAIDNFFPDFTIHPGDRGTEISKRLLTFVPDVLCFEGNKAFLIYPRSSDSAVYAYGRCAHSSEAGGHSIFEGKFLSSGFEINHVQVEGYDESGGEPIIVDTFAWPEIERGRELMLRVQDRNLGTVAEVETRGDSYLRKVETGSISGVIRVPLSCGQELYDVIGITDRLAGLAVAKRRVVGISTLYDARKGLYEQRLFLGAV